MLIFSSFQFAVLFLLIFQEVMQTFYSHGNITVRNLLIFSCCQFGGFRVLPSLITSNTQRCYFKKVQLLALVFRFYNTPLTFCLSISILVLREIARTNFLFRIHVLLRAGFILFMNDE